MFIRDGTAQVSVRVGKHEFEAATGAPKLSGGRAAQANQIAGFLETAMLDAARVKRNLPLRAGSASAALTLTPDSAKIEVKKRGNVDEEEDDDIIVEDGVMLIVLLVVGILIIALIAVSCLLIHKKGKTKVMVVDKQGNVIATFESEADDLESQMLMKMLRAIRPF